MHLPVRFVSLSVSNSKTRAWIWMKVCVSTGVGTWMNLSTFEPDPDYSPDAGTGKFEIESRSNRHLTQSRLQVTGCTVKRCYLPGTPRCSQRAREFRRPGSTFQYDVRLRSYGASNLTNFRISAYFPHTPRIYVLARPDLRCSNAWFQNGFIQSPVETTLSELHALHAPSAILV